jgi:hypothetical protein
MATLAQLMQDISREISEVKRNGIATGGSTSTLIDTDMNQQNFAFETGTLWIIASTNNAGLCRRVINHSEATLKLDGAVLSNAIIANDTYFLAGPEPLEFDDLYDCALEALRSYRYEQVDTTLVVVANQEEYTLPTGVSNVYGIEIAENTTTPYSYSQYFYGWREINGKIYLPPEHIFSQAAGNKIKLRYVVPHATIALTGTISAGVNYPYLVADAIERAWANVLRKTATKDYPNAVEFLNRASQKKLDLSYSISFPVRDPKFL